jgi:hypothetical protein
MIDGGGLSHHIHPEYLNDPLDHESRDNSQGDQHNDFVSAGQNVEIHE